MSAWRAFLFAACAIATIGAMVELFCVTGFGAPAWLGIISSVSASSGGRAWQAGVRGDLVDVREPSPIGITLDAVLLLLQMNSQKLEAMNVTGARSGETA